MKTSTKILLAALVIFVIAVGIYNNALKAEYLTGNYKKPYHNSNLVNIKGFTEVEINGADLIDVDIKQGDYSVYNSKYNNDTVTFTKVGNKLIVNVDLKERPLRDTDMQNGVVWPVANHHNNDKITIICPKLTTLSTNNTFTVNGVKVVDCDITLNPTTTYRSKSATLDAKMPANAEKILEKNYNYVKSNVYDNIPRMSLQNLHLDSLSIIAHGSQKITFENSFINNLKVVAGSFSSVAIGSGFVKSADLQINAGAQLISSNVIFPKLVYHISDSARVSLSGASLKSFIKQP